MPLCRDESMGSKSDETGIEENLQPISIIKFGGSVISDKTKPFSLREGVIENLVDQITQFYHHHRGKLIIVHGGGSFGHPLAKQYQIKQGLSNSIPNQILGVSKTHISMLKLNNFILSKMIEKSVPAFSVPPSIIFQQIQLRNNETETIFSGENLIEALLNMNFVPILFGDILFQYPLGFSIISGDSVISEICKTFNSRSKKKYRIEKVIFCFDQDGIIVEKEKLNLMTIDQTNIAKSIHSEMLSTVIINQNNNSIDVTGGLSGKIHEIQKISQLGIPILLLNGSKPERLLNSLLGNQVIATHVIP